MADSSSDLNVKVPICGYIALIFAILFFSGVMPTLSEAVGGWVKAFDFAQLTGSFGKISTFGDFRGSGGSGAKDGFVFALTLVPTIMLALGVIEVIEWLGGIKAAQKLLSPLLRPLMGIPGSTALALVSSLQSTDAGASMAKGLKEEGLITENEKTIFMMFQFTSDATITNFLASGAAIIVLVNEMIPSIVLISFIVMFVLKIFAANIMRLYVKRFGEEG